MHGNSGQYKDAYLQLTDVIKDTPHLFTNTSTYTLPTVHWPPSSPTPANSRTSYTVPAAPKPS